MKPICALTGGRGYVGSSIRRALEAAGWEVVLLQRDDGTINWDLASDTNVGAELKSRGAQVLIHAAWDFSIIQPSAYRRVNLDGSLRLFRDAKAAGIEKLVFISTISAFDSAVSLYGKAKLAVERDVAALGGFSVRPGLVWGNHPGGVFGAMRKTVRRSSVVPLIGSGMYPQYLIHEDDLGQAMAALVRLSGENAFPSTVTLAHSRMWYFRELVLACARQEGKMVRLVGVPWHMIWAALKIAEYLSLRLSFRSDSVLSLVNQNPAPDFGGAERLEVVLRPFAG